MPGGMGAFALACCAQRLCRLAIKPALAATPIRNNSRLLNFKTSP